MRLLFVCTGNLCRSPLAAQLLATWAHQELGERAAEVLITSAGVEAPDGRPMDADSRRALLEAGGDPDILGNHRSRPLDPAEVTEADLVLTMTRWQRRKVLARAPRALRRTFTLPEAADLLARSGPGPELPFEDRARELAGRLNAARATRQVSDRDDVRDPMGRPLEVHRAVAARIATELRPLADVLLTAEHSAPRAR
jgi:protein-tyrosine phosphatase